MLKDANTKGFTIIEVVITIAIGAAVMALVLNAVAGARRSQRNNARTSDISTIVSAANQYVSNHNALPTTAGNITAAIENLNHYPATNIAVGGALTAATVNAGNLDNATALTGANSGFELWTVSNDEDRDQVILFGRAECAKDAADVDTEQVDDLLAKGGIRDMVIAYRLEADPNVFCKNI